MRLIATATGAQVRLLPIQAGFVPTMTEAIISLHAERGGAKNVA